MALTHTQMVEEVEGMIDAAIIEAYPDSTDAERVQAKQEFLQALALLVDCPMDVVH